MFHVLHVRTGSSLTPLICFVNSDQCVTMALIITALTTGVMIVLKTVPIVSMMNTTSTTTILLVSVANQKLSLIPPINLAIPFPFAEVPLITMNLTMCATVVLSTVITAHLTVLILNMTELPATAAMLKAGSIPKN